MMTISDIKLEMRLNGVDEEDIEEMIMSCKSKGYGLEVLDEALEKKGYARFFLADYDDLDEAWDFDDQDPIERFPYKHRFDDEWRR